MSQPDTFNKQYSLIIYHLCKQAADSAGLQSVVSSERPRRQGIPGLTASTAAH